MDLNQLLTTEIEKRDDAWEDQFLRGLAETPLRLLSPEPQAGPDGWPYMMVETDQGTEPAQKILQWLATRGIGLVVNPQKETPDYALSWGMVWSFRETGRFFARLAQEQKATVELTLNQIAHAGTPSPQYLPDYVRSIMREFFRDQGVLQPRILVVSEDRKNYELAFSLESLGNPPVAEHLGILEAIGWFLPPHYALILISEKGLPEFGPL